MKRISIAFQIILGFILGVLVVTGGAAGAAYVMFSKMAKNPPLPVFSEETTEETTTVSASADTPRESQAAVEGEETNTNTTEPGLPANAYRASVIPEKGLNIREEPSLQANRIGGLGHQWEIIVLGKSEDEEWEKIRIPDTGAEGWVKSGNLAKID